MKQENQIMNTIGRYAFQKRNEKRERIIALLIALFLFGTFVPWTAKYERTDSKQTFSFVATVYAYSSEERQTDSTPLITASNKMVRDGIVANNCLPYGTLVRIAGRVFQVEDRMNPRYDCTVFDVWHASTDSAWDWGKQLLEVEIIK